jgi:CubicO group peptidase (beta-lactamase class C family)
MKFLLSNLNLLIAGVLMSHPNWALAQDTLLTQEYLSKIMSDARKRYKVPAIAVTVMNSITLLLQEVQGVRVIDKQGQATLDDYFHIGSCSKSVLAVMAAKLIEQKKITWRTRFFDVFPELSRIRTKRQNHGQSMAQQSATRDWNSSNTCLPSRPHPKRRTEDFNTCTPMRAIRWRLPCLKGFQAIRMKNL